ncbi:MAG: squalene/phytoene synthase family protein [Luteolibacter sp.]
MIKESGYGVLREVSRSFGLSLRLLPKEMREAASLGYLLARSSDTIADVASAPLELRVQTLENFRAAVTNDAPFSRMPHVLLNSVTGYWERNLLERGEEWLAWLRRMPRAEAVLIKEVADTIFSGQLLDLERFSHADARLPVALANAAELEDYAWRVAGCVGAFWTKLGFQALGAGFSEADPAVLEQQGIAYGKGLQLVNILRDLPADLAAGRCYLPVADPLDRDELLASHAEWWKKARDYVEQGEDYADSLRVRRLRAASRLPALLAASTLRKMRDISWPKLEARVKVPRHQVYLMMLRSLR